MGGTTTIKIDYYEELKAKADKYDYLILNNMIKKNYFKSVNDNNTRRSKEYMAWENSKQRCRNENCRDYKNYGGRGIEFCEEWNVFEDFIKDMGKKPFSSAQLDRIDNNSGYNKNNCRWVSRSVNTHNTRSKKEGTSKFKGVSYNKKINRWTCEITKDLKRQYIGCFINETDAAIAYNNKAIELYGEFASINIIEKVDL